MPTVREVIEHNYQRATGRQLSGELMRRKHEAEDPEKLSARAAVEALIIRSAYQSPMSRLLDRYQVAALRVHRGDRSQAAYEALDSVALEILRSGNGFGADAVLIEAGIKNDDVIASMVERGVLAKVAPVKTITVRTRPSPVPQISSITGGPTRRIGITPKSAVRRSMGLST